MAQFDNAFNRMLKHEGGYVNDPDDPGGETYKGIARKIHSQWGGWLIIDQAKTQPGFPQSLNQNQNLDAQIRQFYKSKFWDTINGDLITSQKVAESIFDFGVNAGVRTSAILAQSVVGAVADGAIGPNTLAKINSFNEEHFLAAFTVAKIRRYVQIVESRPTSRKYLYGWIRRAIGS